MGKGKILEGIDFLLKISDAQSEYKTELHLIRNRTINYIKSDRLQIIDGRFDRNRISYDFGQFLIDLRDNERPLLFVIKNDELTDNIPGCIEGKHRSKYPGDKKYQVTRPKKQHKGRKRKLDSKWIKWGIVSLLVLFVLYNLWGPRKEKTGSSQSDLTSASKKEGSPLDDISTWSDDDVHVFGIWLKSYSDLDAAIREKNAFTKWRDIEIMQLGDGRYHLFMFRDSRSEAKEAITRDVKKRWRKALVLPINKCRPARFKSEDYWRCMDQ